MTSTSGSSTGVGPAAEEGATATEALFNSVSILMGVGILSIPYALNTGGWATLGVLAAIWAATNHTGKLLVRCQEYYNSHPGDVPPPGSTIAVRRGVVQTCAPPPRCSLSPSARA